MQELTAKEVQQHLLGLLNLECRDCNSGVINAYDLGGHVEAGAFSLSEAEELFTDAFSPCPGQRLSEAACPALQERPECGHPLGGCAVRQLFKIL